MKEKLLEVIQYFYKKLPSDQHEPIETTVAQSKTLNIYVQVNKLYKTWKSVCEKLEKAPALVTPAEVSMDSSQSTRSLITPEAASVD